MVAETERTSYGNNAHFPSAAFHNWIIFVAYLLPCTPMQRGKAGYYNRLCVCVCLAKTTKNDDML